MSKILLLNSGLKHTQEMTDPFMERLRVYLLPYSDCVDVRDIITFDERTFFEYDQVIFVFSIAVDSIPSSTLEIFQKLETQKKNSTEIYAMICCDEFEPEKCDLSSRIMERWCIRENLHFKGTLKIASALFIMKHISRFIVSKRIKDFAENISRHQDVDLKVTVFNDKVFLKHANNYWNQEIIKKRKERGND